jgi:CheY-like chemotaxis protein
VSKKARILVVDDDRVHCLQLEAVLGGVGFAVETATGGVAALERAAAEPPDLVVCDADMPEMDGWALVRHMRETEALAVVPIFLMLERHDAGARVRAFQVGADACLVKPLDFEELAAQARRKLAHQTQVLERQSGPRVRRPNRRTTSLVLSGQIQKMGIGSVLGVLGLEERSGTLRVQGPGARQARVVLFRGQVAEAEVTGADPSRGAEAVITAVRWREGRYIFRDDRATVHDGTALLRVPELLLEAARREDDAARGGA